VYITLTKRLREALSVHIQVKYGDALGGAVPNIVLERPPKIELGEAASPVAFELAKRLKRAPRMIAQEIATTLPAVEGIAKIEIAGAGYLNAYFDRAAFWTNTTEEKSHREAENRGEKKEKIIVEHTSVNPNKAAHIGHVRNAVLGDTFARILRHAGNSVQVQNYIDNTGVQVADVVIGFLQVDKRTPVGVMALSHEPKFDYYCWDLYAYTTQLMASDTPKREKLRAATLKAIEEGRGEDAEIGQIVADAIVDCHLRTMARLGIGYDLLARESEILHLKFWDAAFEMLKKAGAIELATSGKMAGCWIMPWKKEAEEEKDVNEGKKKTNTEATESPESAEKDDEHEQDKIIVRSNGVVTYVGKDIAYQLWKFGLLGKDFRYRKWPNTPSRETIWATTSESGDAAAPNFGEAASAVYNVIDTRQAYVQDVVAEGLRRTGYGAAADKSVHLSYAMVVLTPRCATELGYELSPDDARRPFVDMSGRKGLGVKADDLIDKLEAATLAEVQTRRVDMPADEQKRTAHAIAVGALRFFLLKFTRNAIIAFDFKDALSFEGETGPYCQNAVVRIRGIRRKGAEVAGTTNNAMISTETAVQLLDGSEGADLWELLMIAGSLDYAVDAAIATQEPSFVAKYVFQLAQSFHSFYHKHHILSEEHAQKRAFFLALCGLVERQLVSALDLLGIEAPEKM
jgi:arginyl-tRNA synthetase